MFIVVQHPAMHSASLQQNSLTLNIHYSSFTCPINFIFTWLIDLPLLTSHMKNHSNLTKLCKTNSPKEKFAKKNRKKS